MHATAYSAAPWSAPVARGPLRARVTLPGSKSLTNRELVLSALAASPSRLTAPLRARDTDLMIDALRLLGTGIAEDGDDLVITPGTLRGDRTIDCGLAGTLMRFLPPVALLAAAPVRFDGDPRARERPMATTIASLRALGATVDDGGAGRLPFTVDGSVGVHGGPITIDASESSQFVSGLLLTAPRLPGGLDLTHRGRRLPSLPHVAMSLACLTARGVHAETIAADGIARWRVKPGPIEGRTVAIEPDLSNAAPFLAAALVAGGRVTVAGWPKHTTQVGDRLREWLAAFDAAVSWSPAGLTVDGGQGVVGGRTLRGVRLDLSEGGELAPTIVALAAFAAEPSRITGIGHLRGHETDRLAALATELGALGARVTELPDGLAIEPAPLTASGRPWRAYGDHRIATTGAVIGLAVPGLTVDDVSTTGKTLPDFPGLWADLLQ